MPNCELTSRPFSISDAEREFCSRTGIPLPQLHPFERIRNMLVFRNRMHLSHDVCAATGKKILSSFPLNHGRVVYDVDVWESDAWDGKSFGREYDFSRPFFAQFTELLRVVPLPNLAVIRSTMENSDYANGITGAKNCYLLFAASFNEDCYLSFCVNYCKDVVACVNVNNSELCFDSRHLEACYNVRHSENAQHCSDSAFLYSCQSCRNCFGCVNLANKEFHFFNESLSADEYKRRMAGVELGSWKTVCALKQQFSEYARQFPRRFMNGKLNESSSGNYLSQTKECRDSYFLTETENVESSVWLIKAKSSLFYVAYGNSSELIYNSISCGDSGYNLKFCVDCWPGAKDLEYSVFTGYSSSNCFGCVGLKRSSYCILNKQYSKEEYFSQLKRIKSQMLSTGEYGKFFPAGMGFFPYNRSDADCFLPLEREAALSRGYSWAADVPVSPAPKVEIEDHIDDTDDGVLQQVLTCELTGKAYKITKAELQLYRRMRIPLPRTAPLEWLTRAARAVELHPLTDGACAECGAKVQTVYAEHAAGVLCEGCYQAEL